MPVCLYSVSPAIIVKLFTSRFHRINTPGLLRESDFVVYCIHPLLHLLLVCVMLIIRSIPVGKWAWVYSWRTHACQSQNLTVTVICENSIHENLLTLIIKTTIIYSIKTTRVLLCTVHESEFNAMYISTEYPLPWSLYILCPLVARSTNTLLTMTTFVVNVPLFHRHGISTLNVVRLSRILQHFSTRSSCS